MKASFQKINLLIIEDEQDVREGTKELISDLLDVNVITASNGLEALNIIKQQPVNIILSDIKMPVMDGIEFATCAKALGSNVPIVFFSAYADKENTLKALRLGAYDFIEKPYQISHLVEVIGRAISKEEKSQNRKLHQFNLSGKQVEILDLLLLGKTNPEISQSLGISEPTVKYHMGEMLEQFEVSSRYELREKVLDLIK